MLPKVQAPIADYVPYARRGGLVFLPGAGPFRPDGTFVTGEVSADVVAEKVYGHARLTGLTLLATMREATGSLSRVAHVGKVFGMVDAQPGLPTTRW